MITNMKIILTGGGTAGHVTPNIALLKGLKQMGFQEIHYIGSENGIEKNLTAEYPEIQYHSIRTGKLRRYFSVKNFTDPFRVLAGCGDAKKLMKEIRPDVVFSKGGFVAVPVVWAAHHYKIPVVAHESEITPGLANKLSKRYATRICLNFPDALKEIPAPLGIYTGTPIRETLFSGDKERARRKLGFDSKKVIMVMGGSLGARAINQAVRKALPRLLPEYNIIHLCGKGNLEESLKDTAGYRQFEFVSEDLPDCFALTDLIVSRAGANAIHEFMALKKPMLLIPLPLSASRGDQILNAKSFESRGIALVLNEEQLNTDTLVKGIGYLEQNSGTMIRKMSEDCITDGTQKVLEVIKEAAFKTARQ